VGPGQLAAPNLIRKNSPTDVPEVLAHVESRVMRLLKRRGLLDPSADGHPVPDEFARRNPAMAAILQASLLDVSVLDADHQLPPMRERSSLPDDVRPRSKNCTQHNQFTLHANTRIAPLDRKGLEKMSATCAAQPWRPSAWSCCTTTPWCACASKRLGGAARRTSGCLQMGCGFNEFACRVKGRTHGSAPTVLRCRM
jgi:hypothetical protein